MYRESVPLRIKFCVSLIFDGGAGGPQWQWEEAGGNPRRPTFPAHLKVSGFLAQASLWPGFDFKT